MKKFIAFYLASFLVFLPGALNAQGTGSSAFSTLTETPSAAVSALGGAAAASSNDIAAFPFNPAAVATLATGHASFLYTPGVFDDAFTQVQIGAPGSRGGYGLSVAHYDGGAFEMFDGAGERTVDAQRELVVGVGVGHSVGRFSFGVTGKYLSSEVLETAKASGFAVDAGAMWKVSSRMSVGLSALNVGPDVKFVSDAVPLPSAARAGLALRLFSNARVSARWLADAEYLLNEEELRPLSGLEVMTGPVALRAGYRATGEDRFNVGMGIAFGQASLDYAVGLLSENDDQHRVSVGFRFGSRPVASIAKAAPAANEGKSAAVARPVRLRLDGQTVVREPVRPAAGVKRRVYEVKPGDSLAAISKRYYGDPRLWTQIYNANRHLISDVWDLEPGQKIVIPE